MARDEPCANERLRRARQARHLTQADVARRLGTSALTVSRWELGVQSPVPHHRQQLCLLFGMDAGELGLEPEVVPADGKTRLVADAHLDPIEAHARRDLLNQVRRYWLGRRLQGATESLPTLQLSLLERPAAVDDPRSVGDRPSVTERPPTPRLGIADAYRHLGEQLLILGDSGSGKTTLLLQLGEELMEDGGRDPGAPMPVVFHLASWAGKRLPLAQWLVDELHRRYGVAPRLAGQWIDGEQVLPLLDGLDEVADPHRAACVETINEFRRVHGQLPIVVCCRTAWYESLGVRLSLRGAVVILPLSQSEVHRHLEEAGPELAGLQSLLAEDEQLRDMLTTPLFLGIAAVAYRSRPVASIRREGTAAERRRQLLGDYVGTMLRRSPPAPAFPRERTLSWLAWLARAMRAHDQSVFYPDWISPSWLPSRGHPWLVTHGLTAATGLAIGLLVGVNWGADWGSSLGPTTFALVAVTVGVVVALFQVVVLASEPAILPAEELVWSWSALRRGIPRWLGIGLASGLLGGLVFGLVLGLLLHGSPDVLSGPRSAGAPPPGGAVTPLRGLATGMVSALVTAVGLGVTIGLTFGLLTGLDKRFGVTDLAPGQSVEASRRNGAIGGAVGGTVFGVAFALVFGLGTSLTGALAHRAAHAIGLVGVYWPVATPNDLLVAAAVGAVIAGIQRGGGAYVRHRALVSILVRTGCLPAGHLAFLEYAARLVLLRRRGGGYEFIHGLLLDYFADTG